MEKVETFESALEKLEKIIIDLESGEVDLDKSIEKYKEAMDLVKICNEKLSNATKTVNTVMKENGIEEEFNVE